LNIEKTNIFYLNELLNIEDEKEVLNNLYDIISYEFSKKENKGHFKNLYKNFIFNENKYNIDNIELILEKNDTNVINLPSNIKSHLINGFKMITIEKYETKDEKTVKYKSLMFNDIEKELFKEGLDSDGESLKNATQNEIGKDKDQRLDNSMNMTKSMVR
jgi:hypothetical protein